MTKDTARKVDIRKVKKDQDKPQTKIMGGPERGKKTEIKKQVKI